MNLFESKTILFEKSIEDSLFYFKQNFIFLVHSSNVETTEISPEEEEELEIIHEDDRITLESETLYSNVT
jgi:hypothetical protein